MSEPVFKKSAKERYPKHFEIPEMVIKKLHEWIDRSDIPMPQTALGIVKLASVVRAYNLYKSINLLLQTDHWEDSAILSRSLFELLLNLEEIARDEERAEIKAKKYLRFQELQKCLHTINQVDYGIQTGRHHPEQASKLRDFQKRTKLVFSEFISKRSRSGWESSWCGKSVYVLAKQSANPMRINQYKIIYSLFSDFSHSSPVSVMTAMSLGNSPEETEQLFRSHESDDKQNMGIVLSLSTIWLLELVFIGKSKLPLYDAKWNFEVLKRIYKTFGVEPPKLPWE